MFFAILKKKEGMRSGEIRGRGRGRGRARDKLRATLFEKVNRNQPLHLTRLIELYTFFEHKRKW